MREISGVALELHAIASCDTTSYKFNIEKAHILKKVCKDSCGCLYEMLVFNITLIEKLSKRQNNICLNYEVWQKINQKLFIHNIQIPIQLLN